MSTVQPIVPAASGGDLPLIECADAARVIAWRQGRPVSVAAFLAHVLHAAEALPARSHAVNLCEDRYAFLVAFCATLVAGQTCLLPPSRAPQAVAEVMQAHAGSYAISDRALDPAPQPLVRLPEAAALAGASCPLLPRIAADHVAAIGYTSGSTGQPRPHPKRWRDFHASNAGNRALLQGLLGAPFHIVATVPPQHIYGLETTVLTPLLGPASVHDGRPFFPADVAAALAQVPAPRLLVTTPVHLRALVAAPQPLPPLAALLSATAPMPEALAQAAEARFGAPLHEVFGSTETCAFASRRSARDDLWTPHPGVRVRPQPDGTVIEAPQLPQPAVLADIVELWADGRFRLCGRNTDLVEIAGKRASLADLGRRLLAIPGVEDAVVCQFDQADAMGVRRIAALVVAPQRDSADILAALRASVDPVFLPRPLRRVPVLPRNETGKLPRRALLALLQGPG